MILDPLQDHRKTIQRWTAWIVDAPDLTAARIGFLLRRQGLDPRTLVCAKIFPNTSDPTTGIVITHEKKVFQFAYNRAGLVENMSIFDEWLNITDRVKDHPWRDEILCGQEMI